MITQMISTAKTVAHAVVFAVFSSAQMPFVLIIYSLVPIKLPKICLVKYNYLTLYCKNSRIVRLKLQ